MQIVIDIDEKEYKRIIEGNWIGEAMAEIFENGIVLPEYGNLIDKDALRCEITDFDTHKDYCIMFDEIYEAPTILERTVSRHDQ